MFGLAALAMTARNLLLDSADLYTHYNNYIIFKNSFFHWVESKNLYVSYPSEQYDLFKYSPFFAMIFGVLAILPNALGLAFWNLTNVMVLVLAVRKIPFDNNKKNLIYGILLLQETITATINSQSNALIAGLLILGWLALEKGNWWKAALFIGFTVFIKLFGLLFFLLFLLYPKWWRGILPALTVCLAMLLIPAVAGGFDTLWMQYKGYLSLLANDHGTFVKYSVMGWLTSWFDFSPSKNAIVFSGLLVQLGITIILFVRQKTSFHQRAMLAGSWMVWMVIFNHMAESATFVIAVAGVLIWYFYSGQPKWLRIVLLVLVMAFTCFGPSDIYPPELRQKIVVDWQLKVFPCIVVWFVALVELIRNNISFSTKQQHEPL